MSNFLWLLLATPRNGIPHLSWNEEKCTECYLTGS